MKGEEIEEGRRERKIWREGGREGGEKELK